jgi:hypothetical protein
MSPEERAQERHLAIAEIEGLLDELRSRQSPADLWERSFLADAIGALFRGAYRLARVNAMSVSEKRENRSAAYPIDPGYEAFELESLENAFKLAKAQDLLQRPILGPILVGRG